jgi:ABC-type glycerol-3-phosphate transport system substrate-binding protein
VKLQTVKSAKEIIWALIMQAGNDVITRGDSSSRNEFDAILKERGNYSVSPAESALNFFTQFSNPNKTIYSWNRSVANSDDYFVAGNSAFYLGFASELSSITQKNPNLNFDVAEVPQPKDAEKKATYGKMHFIGVTRNARNPRDAYQTALVLTSGEIQNKLTKITGLPPVRRDLLGNASSESTYDVIFRKSALYSYGVLEPSEEIANDVVKGMVESIVSGRNSVSEAILKANEQLNSELK